MKNVIGFIVLRHVKNENTNKYWIHCYNCIRQYYPENNIIIIDDNSDYSFITEKKLYKTTIINSEYPGRGELLPYYYYLQNKFFDSAVIIHDSVFINKYIDLQVDKYKILWSFKHTWDSVSNETKLLSVFNDTELNAFYENKSLWDGCFGCMSIITHDYLLEINNKYNINNLLPFVLNRTDRCAFERVIACLLHKDEKRESLLGDIHSYCKWGITFANREKYNHLPMIKVWTGR